MGSWRNWYTRTLEVRIPQGVEVQVLSSPPRTVSSVVDLPDMHGPLAQLVHPFKFWETKFARVKSALCFMCMC